MVINFTDDMLKKAVIKADIYEIETLPADDEIEYEFSNEFKRKIKKLIRQNKTRSQVEAMAFLRMRVVVFVAAIIILLVSAMSVSAMRAAVFEFITEMYEKFTHMFFEESQSSNDAADEFIVRRPSFIPEGFELVDEKTAGPVLLVYEKGANYISYSQQRLEDVSVDINTEGAELEELEFEGLPAKYYSSRGVQNLLWYDDEYLYMVSSTLDRDVVFRVAESIGTAGTGTSP